MLTGVERLRFADTRIALDLGGDAGFVARLAGVLFGPSAVDNKQLVGLGIAILDQGSSYDSLADQALQAIFGARPTNVKLVDLLYTNVMGLPPSADLRAAFTGLLEQGVYTQASLTRFAASLELTAANIHLTGLQATGLEYLQVRR